MVFSGPLIILFYFILFLLPLQTNFSFMRLVVPTPRMNRFRLGTLIMLQKNSSSVHWLLLDVHNEKADVDHERARVIMGWQIVPRRCAYPQYYFVFVECRKCPQHQGDRFLLG